MHGVAEDMCDTAVLLQGSARAAAEGGRAVTRKQRADAAKREAGGSASASSNAQVKWSSKPALGISASPMQACWLGVNSM